jgi:hypothetical protein
MRKMVESPHCTHMLKGLYLEADSYLRMINSPPPTLTEPLPVTNSG